MPRHEEGTVRAESWGISPQVASLDLVRRGTRCPAGGLCSLLRACTDLCLLQPSGAHRRYMSQGSAGAPDQEALGPKPLFSDEDTGPQRVGDVPTQAGAKQFPRPGLLAPSSMSPHPCSPRRCRVRPWFYYLFAVGGNAAETAHPPTPPLHHL